jgi:hypothetical protein
LTKSPAKSFKIWSILKQGGNEALGAVFPEVRDTMSLSFLAAIKAREALAKGEIDTETLNVTEQAKTAIVNPLGLKMSQGTMDSEWQSLTGTANHDVDDYAVEAVGEAAPHLDAIHCEV